jgi:acyl transferase domain-containing protein/acyl carrier protein
MKGSAPGVAIAAVNGRASTVISGLERDVLEVARAFAARGIDTKRLSVSHAFHSPLVEPMLEEFLRVAQGIEYRPPTLPLISNVSGEVAGSEVSTARYWVDHVRRPVRFARSVEVAYAAGARTFIEIGPRPALLGLVSSTLEDPSINTLASLRPGRPETQTIMDAAARWIVDGGRINWAGWFPAGGRRIELPTYGWQRQRYWYDAEPLRGAAGTELDVAAALRRLGNSGALSDAARAQLPAILAALAEQHAPAPRGPASNELFYQVEWRPIEAPVDAPVEPGAWVIVGGARDAHPIGLALERAGRKHRTVGDIDGLRELLASGAACGVIHVLGEGEDSAGQVLAVERVLAAASADVCGWWITRGAVGVTPKERPRHPGQAVIWGLCRTFALEHPRTWGGIIDAPGALLSERADAIVRQIRLAPAEDQLAVRASGVCAMRLVRQPAARGSAPAIEHGTCLITGGLGGLGLHVARWLVRRGARHLVLTGRTGMSTSGARDAVAELEALGASVRVVAADVNDRARMTELLTGPLAAPLTAVFHVAGVSDTTPLEALTPERLEQVLASKRDGTRLLDELTRDLKLGAFVCFSSIAGVWGSGSQAAYAASNAFLDAWAHAARADGRPALAISWGPWQGDGMASGANREYLERRGLRPLAPEVALDALQRALASDVAHCVVADIDWSPFRAAFEAWRPRAMLLEVDDPSAAGTRTAVGATGAAPLISAVEKLPRADRAAYLRGWLVEQVGVLLGHREVVTLDVRRGLFDLGMDSLMLVELRRRLEQGIGRRIAPGVVFSHPNIAALTEFLSSQIDPPETPEAEARPERAPEAAVLERDEDVLRFINDRFEGDDG